MANGFVVADSRHAEAWQEKRFDIYFAMVKYSPRGGAVSWIMKKMKILVVDNEMPATMMAVSLLTQIGFEVQVATKAKKGMEIAKWEKFDLILLEANLPEISGLEIYAELKQRHISYQTPVIFLCSRGGNECRERALALGADDFIEKPFEAEDFISRVLACVEETETV